REEVRKTGLERVVIGLSGGIDSALAAAIAVQALDAHNVLGVLMPSDVSSPDSLDDAEELAEVLGIATLLKPIGPQVEAYFAGDPDANNVRRGNKMARERMSILYDLSARDGALVLGTSTKTELLLGYSTLHGDGAYALDPNGDLYKIQVYAMAEFYDLPEAVRTKAPSADLWVGQVSEVELGYGFHDLDRVLFLLVDQRLHPEEIIDMHVERDFVEAVVRRMRWAQFKRSGPLFAKLSSRTVGIDFRYLRDWGT
ncbi:MAG: NAD+ synthase, partial [bacterium]